MPVYRESRLYVDTSQLEAFAKDLDRGLLEEAFREAALEIAGQWMARATALSPVDEGTLKDSWELSDLRFEGSAIVIELYNTAVGDDGAPYPLYQELGWKQEVGRFVPALGKRLVADWVPGKFFLRRSRDDVEKLAIGILERKIKEAWDKLG